MALYYNAVQLGQCSIAYALLDVRQATASHSVSVSHDEQFLERD